MPGKGFRLRWQPTTTGLAVSQVMSTWTQIVNGSVRLNHIFLKATLPDTTFNFTITSPTGNRIFYRHNIVGELNENVDMIMRGLYTLTIDNASQDDSYTDEYTFQDLKDK